MRIVFAIALPLLLAACATAPAPVEACDCPPEGQIRPAPESEQAARALRLADALEDAAYGDPARLARMEDRIAALEAVLGAGEPVAEPSAEPEPRLQPRSQSVPESAPQSLALDGSRSLLHAVHIASYRTPEQAREGWAVLRARHAALSGLTPRIDRADLGEQGVYLRLKAGPFDDSGAARRACGEIEARGDWCQPTGYDGEPLTR